jgi:hypothetical protein
LPTITFGTFEFEPPVKSPELLPRDEVLESSTSVTIVGDLDTVWSGRDIVVREESQHDHLGVV